MRHPQLRVPALQLRKSKKILMFHFYRIKPPLTMVNVNHYVCSALESTSAQNPMPEAILLDLKRIEAEHLRDAIQHVSEF